VAIEAAMEVGLDLSDIHPAQALLHKLEVENQPLAFTDVPRAEMEAMQACTSKEDVVAMLKKCMRLSSKDGMRDEVLSEYHFHNFMFCQKNLFCPEKASALLSIMRMLHSQTVMQERMPQDKARKAMHTLLERHCRQLPPFSVGIFTEHEVTAIRDYASRTFFRHYAMYAFMYAQWEDPFALLSLMFWCPPLCGCTET
ncbi:unnamed protein product, partial [Polarella glacialis]